MRNSVAQQADRNRIRELNDAFRTSFQGGQVLLTAGVAALSDQTKANVLELVRTFAGFNGDNDPHGEHDLFSFDHDGERYFGKIDYYAPDMQHGSEDPADPAKTIRVLTIMHASEY